MGKGSYRIQLSHHPIDHPPVMRMRAPYCMHSHTSSLMQSAILVRVHHVLVLKTVVMDESFFFVMNFTNLSRLILTTSMLKTLT